MFSIKYQLPSTTIAFTKHTRISNYSKAKKAFNKKLGNMSNKSKCNINCQNQKNYVTSLSHSMFNLL